MCESKPGSGLHVPQGCVVKNIRIKQKLARLRHQQRMLAQHLQQLEESPNTSPALIRQQHQRYNNLLRYYSSWDKVSASSTGATRAPFNEHASPHVGVTALPHRSPLHHPPGPPIASHHYQQQHPRRWLRKRSRAHGDEQILARKDKSISPQQEAEAVLPVSTVLTFDFVIVTTPTLSEKTGSSQVAFTLWCRPSMV
uniref:Uncharacterized protein n=1 Tax=Anopheles farauti TaxID=69004 RepID=A0A182Q745_9DIPT